ncbi:MAG TPA: hypothetical protein VHT27_04520 [Solirubrobacteraceae bacterium]|jgi:hypothetical protein|nr:hypothetical protein [Solirubrobacteraceae bacterium]
MTRCRRGQLAPCLVLALMACAFAPTPALAEAPPIEGASAFALVNEQRAANGIPPFTTENQSLASWCPNEDHGAGGSGNRVLSEFTWAWSATESPWETAPFHEALMYDPSFTEAGDVDATGPYNGTGPVVLAACMSVEHERPRPSIPQGYVFYAPGGGNDVPPAYTAFEAPRTPAEDLGLPATTGPNIIAYAVAANPLNRIPSQEGALAKVSLATEGGEAVNGIRVLESLSESFIIVPPPLQPETHYRGNVAIELNPHAISGEPEVVNDALSFTTTAFPNHATITNVNAVPNASAAGGTVNVYVSNNQDPHATLTASAASFASTQTLTGTPGQQVSFAVPINGPGEVCLNSPPHDGYASVRQCNNFTVTGHPTGGANTTQSGSAEGLERQQLRDLTSCLRAVGAQHVRSLRRHKVLTLACRALSRGVLTVHWYASTGHGRRGHKPPLSGVASARLVFTSPRVGDVRMTLSRRALALLAHVHGHLNMVGKAAFVPAGDAPINASTTVALRP